MLAQRSVNDTHIEEDLASVADLVEFGEGVVKLIAVVASKGSDPSLDFLCNSVSAAGQVREENHPANIPASTTWPSRECRLTRGQGTGDATKGDKGK